MRIIGEIKYDESEALRLFESTASPRRNNVRIHYHTSLELSLITGGRGLYKTANAALPVGEGDVFFFRPNESHCITDVDEGGLELLNLHVAPYYLYASLQNALGSSYARVLSASFPLKSNGVGDFLSEADLGEIRRLMLSIKREFIEKKSDYVTVINALLSTALVIISRGCDQTSPSDRTERRNRKMLLSVIEYVDKNYKRALTLDEIASHAAYSRCYLSTAFKRLMGTSVWDYVSIKRIEAALTLIKTTDLNVADVALECGFNNAVVFNKLFKKYTNLTPSAFRNGGKKAKPDSKKDGDAKPRK